MIWVIVPFFRPHYKDNVLSNIRTQTILDKKILIVENGDAIGTFNKSSEYTILSSDKHCAYAKNTALDFIKRNGGGFWTTFDDDDYYGPTYLEELDKAKNKANVIGKENFFINFGNELYSISGFPENNLTQNAHIYGSTISAWAEESVYFEPIMDDDFGFINNMKQKGATVYSTTKYNYCFNRHTENTIKLKKDRFFNMTMDMGGLDGYDIKILEYDAYNKDVINSKVKGNHKEYKRIISIEKYL
jgi:hypothetical protein